MSSLKTQIHDATKPYMRREVATWLATAGLAVAAAIATALLLSGCSSGITPKSQLIEPQSLKTDASFSDVPQSGAWPAHDWWTAYGDDQLNGLVTEALTGSPTLRAAEARLGRANAMLELARGAAAPGLDAAASAQRDKFSANYLYPPPLGGGIYTTTSLAINFSWDLDFWGRNRSAIEAASSTANAAGADRAAAELALATSVTRAWFQLERLYLLHDVIDASIRQRQDILKLTNQRVSAGLDTNVELRQAEAALPQARLDLLQVEESMQLTRNQLAALIGAGPDRGLSIPRPAAKASTALSLPENVPAELVGRRPDIVAARWRVEAARHDIDNAKAQFYPDVNLAASVGLLSLQNNLLLRAASQNSSFGPAISLPIFQESLRGNLRSRDAEYDAAVEDYNRIVIDSVKDVADQIDSMRSIAAQQVEESDALTKTEQAYSLALQRYQAGLGNYLIVLTAETAVLQQRRADAELKARVLDTNVQLVRALGGGFVIQPALAQSTNPLNPGVTHE